MIGKDDYEMLKIIKQEKDKNFNTHLNTSTSCQVNTTNNINNYNYGKEKNKVINTTSNFNLQDSEEYLNLMRLKEAAGLPVQNISSANNKSALTRRASRGSGVFLNRKTSKTSNVSSAYSRSIKCSLKEPNTSVNKQTEASKALPMELKIKSLITENNNSKFTKISEAIERTKLIIEGLRKASAMNESISGQLRNKGVQLNHKREVVEQSINTILRIIKPKQKKHTKYITYTPLANIYNHSIKKVHRYFQLVEIVTAPAFTQRLFCNDKKSANCNSTSGSHFFQPNANDYRVQTKVNKQLNRFKFSQKEDRYLQRDWLDINWKEVAHVQLSRSIYECFARKLELSGFYNYKKWTPEEDSILKRAILYYGPKNWQQISYCLEGRNNSQCFHRWMKGINPKIKRTKWNFEEDLTLGIALKIYGNNKWSKISNHIEKRTDIQCRERYCNILDPRLTDVRWTEKEDIKLLNLYEQFKNQWSKIAKEFGDRTDNTCWRRYKYLRFIFNKSKEESSAKRKKGSRKNKTLMSENSMQTGKFDSELVRDLNENSYKAFNIHDYSKATIHSRSGSRSRSNSKVKALGNSNFISIYENYDLGVERNNKEKDYDVEEGSSAVDEILDSYCNDDASEEGEEPCESSVEGIEEEQEEQECSNSKRGFTAKHFKAKNKRQDQSNNAEKLKIRSKLIKKKNVKGKQNNKLFNFKKKIVFCISKAKVTLDKGSRGENKAICSIQRKAPLLQISKDALSNGKTAKCSFKDSLVVRTNMKNNTKTNNITNIFNIVKSCKPGCQRSNYLHACSSNCFAYHDACHWHIKKLNFFKSSNLLFNERISTKTSTKSNLFKKILFKTIKVGLFQEHTNSSNTNNSEVNNEFGNNGDNSKVECNELLTKSNSIVAAIKSNEMQKMNVSIYYNKSYPFIITKIPKNKIC